MYEVFVHYSQLFLVYQPPFGIPRLGVLAKDVLVTVNDPRTNAEKSLESYQNHHHHSVEDMLTPSGKVRPAIVTPSFPATRG